MKKIEQAAVRVAALASVDRPLNSFHLRASRKLKEAAREAYERLAGGQELGARSPVYAQLDWEAGATARGYKLGVEEFSRRHPKMARELRETIDEQRACERVYVSWKVRGDLPKGYVLGVLNDLGLEGDAAETTYAALQDMEANLNGRKQNNSVLVTH